MVVLLVLAILVFLIVVHEFGHFLAAKMLGVRVEEFGVGYPPLAFSFGTWRGTEYTLNWLPFGGFVRLYGDADGVRGPGSLTNASRSTQAIILIAGVTMNLLAAWGLFTYAYMLGVPRAVNTETPGATLIVSEVLPASPASAAGITAGDRIIGMTDNMTSAALTPDGIVSFVRTRAGHDIDVTFVHGMATTTAIVRPANAVLADAPGRAGIGVGLVLVADNPLSSGAALKAGLIRTYYECTSVAIRIADMIRTAFSGSPSLSDIVGPIGLVGVVGEAATHGWGYVLGLAAVISANLVIINLVPIPALDGGRLLFLALEAILRRPLPRGFATLFNVVGMTAIALLMLVVTYHDIARLLA
jgi:regulator of sigma E protease